MTRQEEIDRLAEIEAIPTLSAKFKAKFREDMERQWMLEEAGVIDMWRFKHERMVQRVNRRLHGG